MTDPTCNCALAYRQSEADADAALYGKIAARLWHNKRCPISMLVQLHHVENRLSTLDDAPMLDDPIIKQLQSDVMQELHHERGRLRVALGIDRPPTPKRANPRGSR